MNTNYLTIPYNILNLEELTLSAKVLLAEIISLSKLEGYCFASNEYLAERLDISLATVKNALHSLKNKGYITSKLLNCNERFIYPSQAKIYTTPQPKNSPPPSKNYTGGRSKISHNNKRYNNKYNNSYNENKSHSRKSNASYDIEELMKIR